MSSRRTASRSSRSQPRPGTGGGSGIVLPAVGGILLAPYLALTEAVPLQLAGLADAAASSPDDRTVASACSLTNRYLLALPIRKLLECFPGQLGHAGL